MKYQFIRKQALNPNELADLRSIGFVCEYVGVNYTTQLPEYLIFTVREAV